MPTHHDPIGAVRALGFTEMEGRVYVWLAREGSATGYAVAKGIAKPVANVYKAIESLIEKGAVEIDEGGAEGGDAKTCRAVPIEELIAAARGRFDSAIAEAEEALTSVGAPAGDDGVYRMGSAHAVIERAKAMLARAQRSVVLDALPAVARALSDEVIAACQRGVHVAALVYEDTDWPGAQVIVHDLGRDIEPLMGAQHLLVSRDALEVVLALIEGPDEAGHWKQPGGVRQAIYSQSPFFAWHLHDNFHHQLFTYAVFEEAKQDTPLRDRLLAIYRSRLHDIAPLRTLGMDEILRRFGTEEGRARVEEFRRRSERARAGGDPDGGGDA
ncbi:MAG: TrmB family transcriptional regulator [Phycisphaerales bacterium]